RRRTEPVLPAPQGGSARAPRTGDGRGDPAGSGPARHRGGDATGRAGNAAIVALPRGAGCLRRPPQRDARCRSVPVRTLLAVAALALAPRAGAAAVSAPCAPNSRPQGPDDPRLREWLRGLVHEVAREEGVDPHVLEALGMTETALQPALGRACEVGPFQVMPWWAGVFRLDSPQLLWDPRINAIAAARIYKAAWRRWDARFARAGSNRVLRAAGWRGPLDRETFAAQASGKDGPADGDARRELTRRKKGLARRRAAVHH